MQKSAGKKKKNYGRICISKVSALSLLTLVACISHCANLRVSSWLPPQERKKLYRLSFPRRHTEANNPANICSCIKGQASALARRLPTFPCSAFTMRKMQAGFHWQEFS